jgi:farnesyl-diphosphate farnesyltransferase
MSVNHDIEFQNQILPRVSRTFSLTIPQLPAGLKDVVANAYLLCRIADTIEDDPELDANLKLEFMAEFLNVMSANSGGEDFSRRLTKRLSERNLSADRELVKNTATVIRIMSRFTSTQRQAVLRCVKTMCKGMHEFQSVKTLDGLPKLIDLDRYCYFVAGIVGEMLTDLFCEHSPELNAHRDELMTLSVCFGQGLQMTNILKDIWEDRDANTCWLPRSMFHDLDGGLSRAMHERDTTAITGGIEKLVGIAHTHLRAALRYTQLIPQHETGIRRFCLWAIGMALLTLRQIYKHPGYDNGRDVKISRLAVRATVLLCNTAQKSNRAIGLIFTLASQGLPLANSLEYCPPPGARLASDRLA